MPSRYVHHDLGEEVRAIGGSYTLLKEVLVPDGDRQVLAVVGVGVFDTSCCGAGGCAYALVPGHVLALRTAGPPGGPPQSLVEPITDAATRKRLAAVIRRSLTVQDVRFLPPQEAGETRTISGGTQ